MRVPISKCCRLALALALFSTANGAHATLSVNTNSDPVEADIAQVTAEKILDWQFSQHPFDGEISSRFLDRYLDALDYYHVFFLESDLKEFEVYRTNLQVYTLQKHDVSPAYVMFSRFMERVNERVECETNFLQTGKFDFTGHDRFTPDRHKLPNPATLDEAREMWRQEVRFDYLNQKLAATNMGIGGPAVLDGKGNVVITLPMTYTNYAPTETSMLDGDTDVVTTALASLLPGKILGQDRQEIASVANMGSNIVLTLALPKGGTLTKYTNNFFAQDGSRLGGIQFVRARETTNEAAARKASAESDAKSGKTPDTAKADATANYIGVVEFNQKDGARIAVVLKHQYVRMLTLYSKFAPEGHVLESYLTALARAYDPHSDYFGHAEAETFKIQMQLSLFGIGAKLEKTQADKCVIDELIPNGPAEKSGKITPHDCILAVAQENSDPVPLDGLPIQKVVDMIRGPKGTKVTLTIQKMHPSDPSKRQILVELTRDEIKLVDKESKAKLFEEPAGDGNPATRIGVIDVPSFYANMDRGSADGSSGVKSVTRDVLNLIKRLKKENARGVILDLRNNGGGYLEEAIQLTGLFIGKGKVVQTKDPGNEIESQDPLLPSVVYDGPLIVLTSRLSASASEILAGALQDYDRALIVGDKTTFGKGTVQTVQPLERFMAQKGYPTNSDPGSLHVTIKKFYRASGETTESNGVASDIVLPSIRDYADFGESSQPNFLPADEISSAEPRDMGRVKPYVDELRKRSLARREKEKDFAYVQEDIDQYRKMKADKSISMNEAERLANQKKDEERAAARKKERASRPKSAEKVFDITLEKLTDPLQPAAGSTNSPAAANGSPDDDDSDSASDDDSANDPTLAETRRIMDDYISLMSKPVTATAAKAQ